MGKRKGRAYDQSDHTDGGGGASRKRIRLDHRSNSKSALTDTDAVGCAAVNPLSQQPHPFSVDEIFASRQSYKMKNNDLWTSKKILRFASWAQGRGAIGWGHIDISERRELEQELGIPLTGLKEAYIRVKKIGLESFKLTYRASSWTRGEWRVLLEYADANNLKVAADFTPKHLERLQSLIHKEAILNELRAKRTADAVLAQWQQRHRKLRKAMGLTCNSIKPAPRAFDSLVGRMRPLRHEKAQAEFVKRLFKAASTNEDDVQLEPR